MRCGFTLIEFLVVLVMIVIIGAIGLQSWVYLIALPKPWGTIACGAEIAVVVVVIIGSILARRR